MLSLLLFLALCALSGSRWLLPETGAGPAWKIGFLAVAFGIVGLQQRFTSLPSKPIMWGRSVWSGVLTFGIPVVLLTAAQQRLASSIIVAIWCFLPVVVVFRQQIFQIGPGAAPDSPVLFWVLVAFGGELLVLPVGLPGSVGGVFGFSLACAATVCAGFAAPSCYDLLSAPQSSTADTGVALGAAGALAVGAVLLLWTPDGHVGPSAFAPALWEVAADLIEASLLLRLVKRLEPERFATRALLVPLVVLAEAVLQFRAGLSWRMAGGALLIVIGVLQVWRSGDSRFTGSMSLG